MLFSLNNLFFNDVVSTFFWLFCKRKLIKFTLFYFQPHLRNIRYVYLSLIRRLCWNNGASGPSTIRTFERTRAMGPPQRIVWFALVGSLFARRDASHLSRRQFFDSHRTRRRGAKLERQLAPATAVKSNLASSGTACECGSGGGWEAVRICTRKSSLVID